MEMTAEKKAELEAKIGKDLAQYEEMFNRVTVMKMDYEKRRKEVIPPAFREAQQQVDEELLPAIQKAEEQTEAWREYVRKQYEVGLEVQSDMFKLVKGSTKKMDWKEFDKTVKFLMSSDKPGLKELGKTFADMVEVTTYGKIEVKK